MGSVKCLESCRDIGCYQIVTESRRDGIYVSGLRSDGGNHREYYAFPIDGQVGQEIDRGSRVTFNHIRIYKLIIGNRRDLLFDRPSCVCPRLARTKNNEAIPAKRGKSFANRLVDSLPEALRLVSILGFWIVQDRLRGRGLPLRKKIVNIDHIDLGMGLNPAQNPLYEDYVLEVTETEQVIPRRSRREPIGGRGGGECDLKAAIPEEQHLRLFSKVNRRGF